MYLQLVASVLSTGRVAAKSWRVAPGNRHANNALYKYNKFYYNLHCHYTFKKRSKTKLKATNNGNQAFTDLGEYLRKTIELLLHVNCITTVWAMSLYIYTYIWN